MAMNKVKLDICGSSYIVSTTDSEEYMLNLADKLNQDMEQLMGQNRSVSTITAAVISALTYLDELEKLNNGTDNMRAQIKGYLEDAAAAKLEVERAKKEIERLRREIGYLKGAGQDD